MEVLAAAVERDGESAGYDTLEYSWVKATAVSVHLRILFVMLQNTNKLSGAVAGER